MKLEKMTDEELDAALRCMTAGHGHSMEDKVRAHIAALEAERDVAIADDERRGAVLSETVNERDALRERVQALEANLDESSEQGREWLRERDESRERLAAIRQRAKSVPDTPLRQFILDAPVDGVWEGPVHPSPEHDHRYRADGSCECGESVREASEPTTAEAFAAALEAMRSSAGINERGRGRDALSLLERRMGALDAALRDAITAFERAHPEDHSETTLATLRAALTDAPHVFTLEEVESAISAATVPSHLEVSAELKRCIRANLSALHR